MWLQFFAQNAHFGINLFAALVCLGICWLYLDAWTNKHSKKEFFKWSGFGILGISFLFEATVIEQSILGNTSIGRVNAVLSLVLRLVGYVGIIAGQLIDPLQAIPNNKGLDLKPKGKEGHKTTHGVYASLGTTGVWALPAGGLLIAYLYWRRATTGLERHLKSIAIGFAFIGLSDIAGLATLLKDTTNPQIYTYVAAFGSIWWLQHLILLGGVITLGRWTWGYLLKRFYSQLFMIFTAMIVVVFMVVSIGFTGLLIKNIQTNSLSDLQTAANVLDFALSSRKSETSSAAMQLSGNTDLQIAIKSQDREKLKIITDNYLLSKHLTSLIITDQSGKVLLRAEDSEQWGDSLSNDILVKRTLVGLDQATMSVREGTKSPIMQIKSGVSVKDEDNSVIGSITAAVDVDTAFVDGIRSKTGLQSSVYTGSKLSATTFVAPDGKSRLTGVKLTNKKIIEKVLNRGEIFSGNARIQNRNLLTVFYPVKDADNEPIGMFMVAKPQNSILTTAGHSIEVTFILMVVVLLVSIYPILRIARSLVRQIE